MSKKIINFLGLLIVPLILNAQVIAGEIPSGMILNEQGIYIEISTTETMDSAFLDVDLDGNNDLQVILHCAYTAIDFPNSLSFKILDPSVTLCSGFYTDMMPEHVITYNFGESILCEGVDTSWYYEESIPVSSYGSFITYGESSATDVYFAYEKNAQVGWIKASWDLVDGGAPENNPITLSIPELIIPGSVSITEPIKNNLSLNVIPNPSSSGEVSIKPLTKIEEGELMVFNNIGQLVNSQKVAVFPFILNTYNYTTGVYHIILKNKKEVFTAKMIVE